MLSSFVIQSEAKNLGNTLYVTEILHSTSLRSEWHFVLTSISFPKNPPCEGGKGDVP